MPSREHLPTLECLAHFRLVLQRDIGRQLGQGKLVSFKLALRAFADRIQLMLFKFFFLLQTAGTCVHRLLEPALGKVLARI